MRKMRMDWSPTNRVKRWMRKLGDRREGRRRELPRIDRLL